MNTRKGDALEKVKFIIDNFTKMKRKEIASEIGVSHSFIYTVARDAGLIEGKANKVQECEESGLFDMGCKTCWITG